MNETEAINLAEKPWLITDALQCNEVVGFLNAKVTDLDMATRELELAADIFHVNLLREEGKSIALKEAEWKISEPYKAWRDSQVLLRKFRALRKHLREKEEDYRSSSKFVRDNYENYPRAIN